jgi:release factor glutamine methyltransferase
MPSVLEIIHKSAEFLGSKGVESPRLNAEHLIGHALKLKRMQLYLQFERALTEPELELIRPLIKRRSQREPLHYIVGTTEFAGLKLKTDRRALIPRPETEYLVEILTGLFRPPPARVLDLGTGSGAIALALAHAWPEARVTAVDSSPEALELADENRLLTNLAERVSCVRSEWFERLEPGSKFELIVSNPPYLSGQETAEAEPEVRNHEPKAALVAADAGLADLRTIVRSAPPFLAEGGMIALETGITHHAELTELALTGGFSRVESRRDLTGRDRFLLAWMAGA